MRRLPGMRLAVGILLISAAAWAKPPRIVIDPGHGGAQDGAVAPHGRFEKDLCLSIAKKVARRLRRGLHAKVYLTRTRDVTEQLSQRVAFANRLHPDLFISIHANSMPTRALRAKTRGVETYFLSASASGAEARSTADRENAGEGRARASSGRSTLAFILADLRRSEAHKESSHLAYDVQRAMIRRLHAVDRGVQQAPFYVLTGVTAPAILVEVGFISQPSEAKKLFSSGYQTRIAAAVTSGVRRFLEERRRQDGGRGAERAR